MEENKAVVVKIGGVRVMGIREDDYPSRAVFPISALEVVGKEVDRKIRAAFEEGFAAASVPVLAEGQL